MAIQRHQYTPEYRQECADYVLDNDLKVSDGAEALGVNEKTLGNWVIRRKKEREQGTSGTLGGTTPEQRELTQAKKRIRELEMENEFLKKAAAFFAKDQA